MVGVLGNIDDFVRECNELIRGEIKVVDGKCIHTTETGDLHTPNSPTLGGDIDRFKKHMLVRNDLEMIEEEYQFISTDYGKNELIFDVSKYQIYKRKLIISKL